MSAALRRESNQIFCTFLRTYVEMLFSADVSGLKVQISDKWEEVYRTLTDVIKY